MEDEAAEVFGPAAVDEMRSGVHHARLHSVSVEYLVQNAISSAEYAINRILNEKFY